MLGVVGGASPPRVVDDGIVVPQLQGPLSGVGLDELSLEAAKATPAGKKSSLRLACKTLASKSFWHRPDDLGTKALGLEVTRARPTAPLSELPRRPKRDARAKTKWFRLWSKPWPSPPRRGPSSYRGLRRTTINPASASGSRSTASRRRRPRSRTSTTGYPGRGLRRFAGGPLLRLHGARRARRRARGGRGGLPRVAQVPRVHLRADQVRLGRRDACPLLPVPRLVRGVPFHASVVVFELHPSSPMDTRAMRGHQ